MSMSPNVEEVWTPEPELRDPAPRRMMLSQYDDLNKPSMFVFAIFGGAILATGLICLVYGLANTLGWYITMGVVFTLAGAALLVIYPARSRSHMTRAQNLVENGVPIPARVVSVSNMTGDSVNGRSVKYQVTLPTGDMVHREVNADDRALPKRIPGNATALIDPRSSDVELYAALPFRAVPRAAFNTPTSTGIPGLPTAEPQMATVNTGGLATISATPTGTPGDDLVTLGASGTPPGETTPPPTQKPTKEPAKKRSNYQGLPWE